MTVLALGNGTEDAQMYFAHPLTSLRKYFDRPYLKHVPVPGDATDTGYELKGRHLRLSTDQDYAYVGTQTDADGWPRATNGLGCA